MTEHEYKPGESIPFFPDHVKTEFNVVLIFSAIALIIGILGMSFHIGLEEPADALNTPMHVKPEWYFLGLYQLLKYIPKTLGVLIPIGLLVLVLIWPFLDNKLEQTTKPTKIRFVVSIVGMIILIGLTFWGGRS